MSANHRYETLSDITRRGFNALVQCGCGHSSIVDARRLERWYRCHRWSTSLHMLRDHLYCLRCGGRPTSAKVRPCAQDPTAPNRFPNTEEQWERLIRGLRS